MEILKIEKVNKSYKNKVILEDINLVINSGEIIGLIGKNGAGKSTLMKLICHLVKVDDGVIEVCGKDIYDHREEILNHISAIIETPSLYPNLTVKQQIEMNASLRHLTKQEVIDAFEYIDFGKDINLKNSKLSIGMKQEVALAMAFMNKPKLYLLDEPTNGLDFENVMKFRNKVLKEKEKGSAIIISSHILKELEIIADRFVFIQDGRIIGEKVNTHGDIENIYKEMMIDERAY